MVLERGGLSPLTIVLVAASVEEKLELNESTTPAANKIPMVRIAISSQ
jgi:hypothetical protein